MNPHIIVVTHSKHRGLSSIRKPSEDFKKELRCCFVVELLVFALLVAISAWPIIHTAEALRSL